jgi:hypothetical protein
VVRARSVPIRRIKKTCYFPILPCVAPIPIPYLPRLFIMIFPKGRVLRENLDPLSTPFDHLLSALEKQRFSGNVFVFQSQYEGVLVFERGKLSAAFDELDGVNGAGDSAMQQIYKKGKEHVSSISVYSIPNKTISRLLSMGNVQLHLKDLKSTVTELNDLIGHLNKTMLQGCIDVAASNNSWRAIIFVAPDHMVDSFLWNEEKIISGMAVLSAIAPLISQSGAVFNVFIPGDRVIPIRSSSEQLLAIWSEIIDTVDKTVTPLSKKSFQNTLKDVFNEISVTYPFLHCIRGHFRYNDGKALFGGLIDKRLSEGLGKALSLSVSRLHQETPQVNMPILVKNALRPLIQSQSSIVQHFSLVASCDLFNMTTYERVLYVAQPFFGQNTDKYIERQCLNKIGITAESLKLRHIADLVKQIEKSAALVISKNEVKQLCQSLESLEI